MFLGITGKAFQWAKSSSGTVVRGMEVGAAVLVGRGVIGENFLGFGVLVGRGADDLLSKSGVGNVCVTPLTGILRASGVAVPVQAVIKTLTIMTRIITRFIRQSIS